MDFDWRIGLQRQRNVRHESACTGLGYCVATQKRSRFARNSARDPDENL